MKGNKEGLLTKMTREHKANRAKPLSLKNPVMVFDPPEIIELRKELTYHPALVQQLGANEDDLPTIIGILAAAVDIAMDGDYSHTDLNRMAEIITDRLREKRGAVLVVRGN